MYCRYCRSSDNKKPHWFEFWVKIFARCLIEFTLPQGWAVLCTVYSMNIYALYFLCLYFLSSVCSPPRSTEWSLQTSGWRINSIPWSSCSQIWSIWSVITAWSCSGEIVAAYFPPHMVIDSEWSHLIMHWFKFWQTESFMLTHPNFDLILYVTVDEWAVTISCPYIWIKIAQAVSAQTGVLQVQWSLCEMDQEIQNISGCLMVQKCVTPAQSWKILRKIKIESEWERPRESESEQQGSALWLFSAGLVRWVVQIFSCKYDK